MKYTLKTFKNKLALFTHPSEFDAYTNDGARNMSTTLTLASIVSSPYIGRYRGMSNADNTSVYVLRTKSSFDMNVREVVMRFNLIQYDANVYNVFDNIAQFLQGFKEANAISYIEESSGKDKIVTMDLKYKEHTIAWQQGAHHLVGVIEVVFFDTSYGWYEPIPFTTLSNSNTRVATIDGVDYPYSHTEPYMFNKKYTRVLPVIYLVNLSNSEHYDWVYIKFLNGETNAQMYINYVDLKPLNNRWVTMIDGAKQEIILTSVSTREIKNVVKDGSVLGLHQFKSLALARSITDDSDENDEYVMQFIFSNNSLQKVSCKGTGFLEM